VFEIDHGPFISEIGMKKGEKEKDNERDNK
jgi:hypothetical protein